jgi:hypothetical protein
LDPPGKLTVAQRYDDTYFGWPVAPVRRQHPIRSTFLDPRADDRHGAIYHEGVDIAVNDELRERGAPRGVRIGSTRSREAWSRRRPGRAFAVTFTSATLATGTSMRL